ncbi:MAG: elongation factor P [Elusimicrobia bacterium]|nr:elongation factor P [Elusimicrobiota bacterium]
MTVLSTELKESDVIRLDNALCKVVAVNIHTGGGKTGAMVHAKIRNLDSGQTVERRLSTTDRIEKIDVERIQVQYLYPDGDNLVFMNASNYEQLPLARVAVGAAAEFLKEGDSIAIEMFEGRPVGVDFPHVVEAKVASAGSGLRGDTTYKEATLENGMTVMVPQFVREGDMVRIDIETKEFVDRVREKTQSHKTVFKPAEKPAVKKPAAPENPPKNP